ncbi:MAG: cytochrome P450 [Novosphingobium sp.]|nr:cytochrome P450 [Novosphingobium sp.]
MAEDGGTNTFDVAQFAQNFDHHSRDYTNHLNAIFAHMREQCPVAYSDAYGGFWVLTRYADVMQVVHDDVTWSKLAGMSIPSNREPADPPTFLPGDLDPPEHDVYRHLLDPLLNPSALIQLDPFIRQTVRELIDDFIEKGKADLVQDLAAPLTALVTLKFAGLPLEEWPHHVAERREANSAPLPPEEEMRRVMERFQWTHRSFMQQLEIQRENPVWGGMIERLINTRIDGRPLTDEEYAAIMLNVVIGGLETTQALLGSAWVHLSECADERADLQANLNLMPAAVEEMLRCFSPQPGLARIALCDTEVGGQAIRKGERIFMCWASANYDAAKFDDPERFDIRRKPNRHLTFGAGVHQCYGRNLTRLEAQICMTEVLTRLPDYRVDEGGVERIPDSSTVYGYLTLPVTFTPGVRSD